MAAQAQAAESTAVARVEPRRQGVVADVQKMEKQFALALPEHVSPEKFVRVVMTAINTNPDLQKADRQAVLAAAMKCAQDGLLPDGKEAALVTYGNKAQYLPMIAGVLTKVRRSGELKTISAHIVYANDAFTYTLGDDEKIEHTPRMDGGDRGKPIAAYAIAHTKDGGIYREIMSIEQVNQVRNVSRAKNNGPWVAWWDEMARKTVLRRLSKRLPMSTDLQQVFQRDDDHYDLRQAEGAARLRRLHADFEDPGADDVIEATVVPDEPAASEPEPSPDDDFPGDRQLDEFDPIAWAAEQNRRIEEAERVADLDAITGADDVPEKFGKLETAAPAAAKALDAAVRGKRKALTDKERGE